MTVSELTALLSRYPGDALVMVPDFHSGAATARGVEDIPLRKLEYEGRVWGECWDDGYPERGSKVHASREPVTGVLIL
jgi:hypothetical protein